MAAGGPGAGRVATPARPARARAHAVGLGHLLHERARAVLHTTRLGVAPAGKGIEVGDLTRPHSPHTLPHSPGPLTVPGRPARRPAQQPPPSPFPAAPGGSGSEASGLGEETPGTARGGGPQLRGWRGVGHEAPRGRYLQDSALLLKAGPGLLRPLRALRWGSPDETRGGTPLSILPHLPRLHPPPKPTLGLRPPLRPHLLQALRLRGVLGLHQLQLFLPTDPRNVRSPGRPGLHPRLRSAHPRPSGSLRAPWLSWPRRAAAPALGVPPKHLQRHQLCPELLLCALLTQLFPSVVEELGMGFVRVGFAGLRGAGNVLGGGDRAKTGARTTVGLPTGS